MTQNSLTDLTELTPGQIEALSNEIATEIGDRLISRLQIQNNNLNTGITCWGEQTVPISTSNCIGPWYPPPAGLSRGFLNTIELTEDEVQQDIYTVISNSPLQPYLENTVELNPHFTAGLISIFKQTLSDLKNLVVHTHTTLNGSLDTFQFYCPNVLPRSLYILLNSTIARDDGRTHLIGPGISGSIEYDNEGRLTINFLVPYNSNPPLQFFYIEYSSKFQRMCHYFKSRICSIFNSIPVLERTLQGISEIVIRDTILDLCRYVLNKELALVLHRNDFLNRMNESRNSLVLRAGNPVTISNEESQRTFLEQMNALVRAGIVTPEQGNILTNSTNLLNGSNFGDNVTVTENLENNVLNRNIIIRQPGTANNNSLLTQYGQDTPLHPLVNAIPADITGNINYNTGDLNITVNLNPEPMVQNNNNGISQLSQLPRIALDLINNNYGSSIIPYLHSEYAPYRPLYIHQSIPGTLRDDNTVADNIFLIAECILTFEDILCFNFSFYLNPVDNKNIKIRYNNVTYYMNKEYKWKNSAFTAEFLNTEAIIVLNFSELPITNTKIYILYTIDISKYLTEDYSCSTLEELEFKLKEVENIKILKDNVQDTYSNNQRFKEKIKVIEEKIFEYMV